MIPNKLPTISRGAHEEGSGEACVMEYIALLAGEEWTDMPRCTNRHLASAAMFVNDTIADENRGELINLIGRLFGTDASLAPHEQEELREMYLQRDNYYAGWQDWEKIAHLERMIDRYDEMSGRSEKNPVPQEEILKLGARLEAMANDR